MLRRNNSYEKIYNFAEKLIEDYNKFNIDDVEVVVSENFNLSVQSRHQKLENINRSKNTSVGINLFKEKRKATITSNNIENTSTTEFLEKGSANAKSIPIDEYSGLPEKFELEEKIENLDLEDSSDLSDEQLLNEAMMSEEAMLSNSKVTNSEGATRSISKNTLSFINSKGFNASYTKTFHSIAAIAIAGSDTNMQRDYEYSSAIHAVDLKSVIEVGSEAARRAASRLNSKKIKSCTLDVIFEPRVAKSILSSFCSCASEAL